MTNGNDLVTPYAWKIGEDGKTPVINDNTKALTKREYFTAMAIQGILSNPALINTSELEWAAVTSVKAADQIINALNKQL